MTLQSIRDNYQKLLKNLYSKEEIDLIFFHLAELYLNKKKTTLRAGLHENWSEIEASQILFESALFQLQKGTPYQYVTGETEFYGLPLFVNKNVLIPRPETEELVDWIVKDYKNNLAFSQGTFLDIGTGSGAIAIALKKAFPNAVVHALDISQEALDVAKKNADFNQVKIHFHLIDIMNTTLDDLPTFDIIVSNPPYIPAKEKENMDKNVIAFEPHTALFVEDENPTCFYSKISELAQDKLSLSGRVYLETHQEYMEEVKQIYEYGFARVKAKKDISQNWRMLRAEQAFTCK